MALLWCDGFDHYGINGNLTEGAWASVSANMLSSLNPRTGIYHIRGGGGASMRRVLGGAKTTVGSGAAFYFNNLPNLNAECTLIDFRDATNSPQIQIVVQSTGTIAVYRGNKTTLLGTSSTPVVTAESYQHVECMVFISDSVGTVEVRVNGVTAVSLSGIDTAQTANIECSQIIYAAVGNATMTIDMDDLFTYDGSGSYNNTFIGDRRVLTLFPNADTAQADWTIVGAASGYQTIDDTTPDGDSTYIAATTSGSPGVISEFGLENLPSGISAISGVMLVGMMRKTEAGTANVQMSIVSGSFESHGTDRPVTEIYTYYGDVFETDPNTAAPFIPAAVDSLLIKVERTA